MRTQKANTYLLMCSRVYRYYYQHKCSLIHANINITRIPTYLVGMYRCVGPPVCRELIRNDLTALYQIFNLSFCDNVTESYSNKCDRLYGCRYLQILMNLYTRSLRERSRGQKLVRNKYSQRLYYYVFL